MATLTDKLKVELEGYDNIFAMFLLALWECYLICSIETFDSVFDQYLFIRMRKRGCKESSFLKITFFFPPDYVSKCSLDDDLRMRIKVLCETDINNSKQYICLLKEVRNVRTSAKLKSERWKSPVRDIVV